MVCTVTHCMAWASGWVDKHRSEGGDMMEANPGSEQMERPLRTRDAGPWPLLKASLRMHFHWQGPHRAAARRQAAAVLCSDLTRACIFQRACE